MLKLAIYLLLLVPGFVAGQTNCRQPKSNDFRVTTLVDINMGLQDVKGPVQIAVAPDGRVFVAKMGGEIRVYTPTKNNPSNVTLATKIPTYHQTEDGLLGIVLDSKFSTNNWIYAFYSDPCGLNCPERAMELARFTITENNEFINKKIILRFPRARDDNRHASGGLSITSDGVLVFGTGDNVKPQDETNAGYGPIFTGRTTADAQMTSSNTNDLRGKVIRIKPLSFSDSENPVPGIGTTYEIPSGNLWEKINDISFNPNWDASDDINLVRKEVYAYGVRNPYRVRVDSKTGWVFWGDVGPDAQEVSETRGPNGHDEWNLATEPGFFGHPYCNGYNVPYNRLLTEDPPTYGSTFDCADLVNESRNNTGIRHLPPAVSALVAYAAGNSTDDDPRFNSNSDWTKIKHERETAIGGPMYRYDPGLNSSVKFPPYYEGKVFFFDWNRKILRWITLNPDGTIPKGNAGVENFEAPGLPTESYIDAQFGPEGALYMLKYSQSGYTIGTGPQLFKVEYTGPQDTECYKPFEAEGGTNSLASQPSGHQLLSPGFSVSQKFHRIPSGYRTLVLYDITGRVVWNYRRTTSVGSEKVSIPAGLTVGVLWAKVFP